MVYANGQWSTIIRPCSGMVILYSWTKVPELVDAWEEGPELDGDRWSPLRPISLL